METPPIKLKILHPDARVPVKATTDAAGFDVHSVESTTIAPMEQRLINTGFACEIPKGYFGKLCGRSGLAYKRRVTVVEGIIDSDYRGEIKALVKNEKRNESEKIISGERIVQLVIVRIHPHQEMVVCKNLEDTQRSASGFGSSGLYEMKNPGGE
ncbi:deoxyuridine 5'-triphosphate nucleotidohydrolase-like [Tubulanus polymorphus]|uniref:deoxyuridine 5'-triphosphate nucleotidohydrolase-like n=1 Tax=Tubulanus polymorphus TaxID=672921 RepID=UPI003DA31492